MTLIKYYMGAISQSISAKNLFSIQLESSCTAKGLQSVMNNQELGPQLAVDILQFYATNLIA